MLAFGYISMAVVETIQLLCTPTKKYFVSEWVLVSYFIWHPETKCSKSSSENPSKL